MLKQRNSWNISGVDMTIATSVELFERVQLLLKAYDCDHMNCKVCKMYPICDKKLDK